MLEEGGSEGGREIGAGQAGEAGGEGSREGRETPMISVMHGYAQKHASGC